MGVLTVSDLGARFKQRFPGELDDLPDDIVGRRVKEKFVGEFDDFADGPAPRPLAMPPSPLASIRRPPANPDIMAPPSVEEMSGPAVVAPPGLPRSLGGGELPPAQPTPFSLPPQSIKKPVAPSGPIGPLPALTGPTEFEQSQIRNEPPAAPTIPVSSPLFQPMPIDPGTGQPRVIPNRPTPIPPGPGPGRPQTGFDTILAPQEEASFQQWKAKYAPADSGADYDLRGAFKAGFTPDPKTGHWPDTFKKPNHPTFSVESEYAKYAPEKAGAWHGDIYIPASVLARRKKESIGGPGPRSTPPIPAPSPSLRPAEPPSVLERAKEFVMGGPRTGDTPLGRALGMSFEAPSELHVPTTDLPMFRPTSLLPGDPESVPGGIGKGALRVAESLTTAPNLLMVAGTGGLGLLGEVSSLLPRAISAYFGLSMLESAYDQFPKVRQAWDAGNAPAVADAVMELVTTAGMGVLAGRHAVKGAPAAARQERPVVPSRAEDTSTGVEPPVPPTVTGEPGAILPTSRKPAKSTYDRAIEIADSTPSFGAQTIQRQLGLNYTDATAVLGRLVDEGIIRQAKNARGATVYHRIPQTPPTAEPAAETAPVSQPPNTPGPAPAPEAGLKPPPFTGEQYLQSFAKGPPKTAAEESAEAFSEPTYAELFDRAEKLAARRARTKPVVPESGMDERVARVQDARERLALRLTGKPWSEASNPDRLTIDGLINEDLGFSAEEGEVASVPVIEEPAQTAEIPTVPETPETTTIQVDQLKTGERRTVMIPEGTRIPKVPAGMQRTTVPGVGSFLYDPKKIARREIHAAVKENRLPEILGSAKGGLGAPDKSKLDGEQAVVVARTPEGTEVQSTATDQANLPTAVKQAETLTPAGGKVEIVSPEEVIAERQGGKPNTEAAQEPHKFSSTQVQIPEKFAARARDAAAAIPDDELAEDGRESDFHITVKYGLHDEEPSAVKKVLANEPPISGTIGKVSIFPAKETDTQRGGDQYDVVKLDVDSPDLHRINKKIADATPHTDTHPKYQPHVTLAYVKAGEGQKYVGKEVPGLTGQKITFNAVRFGAKDRTTTDIPLAGAARETKPSRLARGVEEKAIANRLTEGFEGKPEYETVKISDQAKLAADLIGKDPQKAIRVAMGSEAPPDGLLPESVFVAVENYATAKRDANLLRELATTSSMSSEATAMGQRISMLAARDSNSAVAAIQKVAKAREQAAAKRYGPKARAATKSQIRVAIKTVNANPKTWASFIESIVCK